MKMTETTPKKTFKQICTCEKCGNEAEMIITCTLAPDEEATVADRSQKVEEKPAREQRTGHATCTHCGNEADIIVDIS
jgi:hypothetical protein